MKKNITLKLLSGVMGLAMTLGALAACGKEAVETVGGKDGVPGAAGQNGKSAYELYRDANGYEGDESQWLADLMNGTLAPKSQVTLKFNSKGGSKCEAITLDGGSTASLPVPTKRGYHFAGWYVGEGANKAQVTNMTPIMGDMTLVAEWSETPKFISTDPVPPLTMIELGSVVSSEFMYTETMTEAQFRAELEISVIHNGKEYTRAQALRDKIVTDLYYEAMFDDELGMCFMFFEAVPNVPGEFSVKLSTAEAEKIIGFTVVSSGIECNVISLLSDTGVELSTMLHGQSITDYYDNSQIQYTLTLYDPASVEKENITVKIDGAETDAFDYHVSENSEQLIVTLDCSALKADTAQKIELTVKHYEDEETFDLTYTKKAMPSAPTIAGGALKVTDTNWHDIIKKFKVFVPEGYTGSYSVKYLLKNGQGTDISDKIIDSYVATGGLYNDVDYTLSKSIPAGKYTLHIELLDEASELLSSEDINITVVKAPTLTEPEIKNILPVLPAEPCVLTYTFDCYLERVQIGYEGIEITLTEGQEYVYDLSYYLGLKFTASYIYKDGVSTVTITAEASGFTIEPYPVYIMLEGVNEFTSILANAVYVMALPERYVETLIYGYTTVVEKYYSELLTTDSEVKQAYDAMKALKSNTELSDAEKIDELQVYINTIVDACQNVTLSVDIEKTVTDTKAEIDARLSASEVVKMIYITSTKGESYLYNDRGDPTYNTTELDILLNIEAEKLLFSEITDEELIVAAYNFFIGFEDTPFEMEFYNSDSSVKFLKVMKKTYDSYLEAKEAGTLTPDILESFDTAICDVAWLFGGS